MFLLLYKGEYGNTWDKIICLVTRSKYSHIELAFDKINVYHRSWSSSTRDGGVRQAYIDTTTNHWDIIPLPINVSEKLFLQEKGKEYDYIGLIGTVIKTPIFSSRRKWFCSEIVAEALGLEDSWKYTPEDLYQLYK